MPEPLAPDDEVLTTGEVARLFRVSAETVEHWEDAGRITGYRTPTGYRRFSGAEVNRLAAAGECRGTDDPAWLALAAEGSRIARAARTRIPQGETRGAGQAQEEGG